MNTSDTRIDLESLLIPNPDSTVLVHYKEKGRAVWLLVDRSRQPAPGEMTLVATSRQKFALQEYQPGSKVYGTVTYVIAPCK